MPTVHHPARDAACDAARDAACTYLQLPVLPLERRYLRIRALQHLGACLARARSRRARLPSECLRVHAHLLPRLLREGRGRLAVGRPLCLQASAHGRVRDQQQRRSQHARL